MPRSNPVPSLADGIAIGPWRVILWAPAYRDPYRVGRAMADATVGSYLDGCAVADVWRTTIVARLGAWPDGWILEVCR